MFWDIFIKSSVVILGITIISNLIGYFFIDKKEALK